MNKYQIKELKHLIADWCKYWKWKWQFFMEKEKLKDLINHIFKDYNNIEWKYSELDTEIFWKLSEENKNKIFDYIDWKDLDKKTKKEINLFWKKIIDLLSSIYSELPSTESDTVQDRINIEMKRAWNALERFIIYSINKNWTDINLEIKKSKNEYEWNKIDFESKYNIYSENIKINFANQLTAWFNLDKKKIDLNNLAYSLDNPDKKVNNKNVAKLNITNYRAENIPDLPILFYVRNWLQNLTRDFKDTNYFNKAYKEIWNKPILENVWKMKDDKEQNRKLLLSIWKSYPIIISLFIEKIKDIDLSTNYSEENIKKAKWFIDINYDAERNIFSVKFKRNDNSNNIEYWLDFYITNKFLKKRWIKYNIERKIKYSKKTKTSN